MALPQKRIAWVSPEDYLLLEGRAETKHEYLDGLVYDWQGQVPLGMAGGSLRHNRVSLNLAAVLRSQARDRGCSVFMADARLNKADRSAYFYPDVMLTCSQADQARNDGISEPCVVIEVLSDSTEAFDRGDKFAAYRDFESMRSYLLVSPERRSIEVYTRDAAWLLSAQTTLSPGHGSVNRTVAVGHLGMVLDLIEVFDGV